MTTEFTALMYQRSLAGRGASQKVIAASKRRELNSSHNHPPAPVTGDWTTAEQSVVTTPFVWSFLPKLDGASAPSFFIHQHTDYSFTD